MAKGTIIFISCLAIIAVILIGINIGKGLGIFNLPLSPLSKTTIFTDNTCGFSFSYPENFTRQKAANPRSAIFVDPQNPKVALAATCASSIPKPPLSSDKIEQISLANQPAVLYHDKDMEGNLRDEIIVKHPTNDMEIIIAGFGPLFDKTRSSFRFVQ